MITAEFYLGTTSPENLFAMTGEGEKGKFLFEKMVPAFDDSERKKIKPESRVIKKTSGKEIIVSGKFFLEKLLPELMMTHCHREVTSL